MTVENLFHIYVSSLSGGQIDVIGLNVDTCEMSRQQTVGLSGKGCRWLLPPTGPRLYAAVIGEVDAEEEPRYETFRIAPGSGELVHLNTVQHDATLNVICNFVLLLSLLDERVETTANRNV